MTMTRKSANRILSGYCVVVAENAEGKIKLFGSPADKASVESGDEILEVNGKKLDDTSHTDVISHIHQSIKSRRVSLKVRRRKGKKLAEEFPSYSIQNAYIVSSDEQAQQNVNLLPHHDDSLPIVPVDMSTLLLCEPPQEINIPDAVVLDLGISSKSLSKPPSPAESIKAAETPPTPLPPPPEDPEAAVEFIRPLSVPEQHRSIEDLLQRTLRNIDTCIQLSKRQEVVTQIRQCDFFTQQMPSYRPKDFRPAVLASEETSRISSSLPSADSTLDMATQIQYNSHREMAIDVPEQFVGTARRPLRYPNNANGDHHDNNPDVLAAMQEAESIKRHAARKRAEDEQRNAKKEKDECLRSSLRNSARLKALEKNSRPLPAPGFYNAAFQDERTGQQDYSSDGSQGVEIIDVPDSQSMKDALDQISACLKKENSEFTEELKFIESLFESTAFRNAADLHHLIESRQIVLAEPASTQAESLVATVKKLLPGCSNHDAQELHAVLSTPQFEHLILAHDRLAAHTLELAQLQPLPPQNLRNGADGYSSFNSDAPTMPADENHQSNIAGVQQGSSPSHSNSLVVVRIEKHGDTPLGATIRIDDENGSVVVARIVHGGAAQRSGLLHEGDELLEVNGVDLRGRSLDEVCELLGRMVGTLCFTVLPTKPFPEAPIRRNDLHVRANFSYDPEDDPYVEALRCPCAGLGLSFQKRDILHILNQDDPCWWQAYRDGEEVGSVLAGLIPSRNQQQRRHDHSLVAAKMGAGINGRSNRAKQKRLAKGKKVKRVQNGSPFDLDVGEVPWYDEVGLFNPKPGQRRPIVLIGPQQIGRKELLERLIASDVERFAIPISHTTRTRKPGETDGREFHFVSKHAFDGEILKQHFVEYGVFEKHLYGTSIESVNQIIKSGKVCILAVEPTAIRLLRAANFKPYVVFIAPPCLDKLLDNRLKMGAPSDEHVARRIIEEAQDMEDTFGHYIDLVIENTDDNSTFSQLLAEINRLERDAQWVPAEWLQ